MEGEFSQELRFYSFTQQIYILGAELYKMHGCKSE